VHDAPAGPLSRATLSDVARLAGVSEKTVSRVISGEGGVSPATRARVLEAAQRLRFRPNHLARDLRRGTAPSTVAFVMGELVNPFYAAVAAGIEKALAEHGLTMVLASTDDDPKQEAAVVTSMLQQRLHSLLLVPAAEDQSYLEGERQLGTPVVCIDRPAQHLAADSVVLDNHDGAVDAVRSLAEHGHRRIAYIGGPPSLYTHRERLSGYRQAMFATDGDYSELYVRADGPDAPSAEVAARALLGSPQPPTAILAGNNRASLGVLRAVRDHPEPVAFISFDDFDMADLLGVTVIAHDPAVMGREAVRLAVLRQDDFALPVARCVLPTRLIRRGSGEIRPPAAG
jgi:LacI family transcriptional regulator